MGRGKAELAIGSETFLERSIRVLATVADPVLVATAPDQPLPRLPAETIVVRDAQPATGPLAAFAGALAAVPHSASGVYLLGCDLPFMTSEFLQSLGQRLGNADAVVPFAGGQWHPLAALYARHVQTKVDAVLSAGKRSMLALLDTITVAPLTKANVQQLDPSGRCLRNVNTPEDYAAALRDAGS